MYRAVVESVLPCVAALGVSLAAMVLLVRLSGARWHVSRVTALHRCQEGGVQSLAFVLTLPVFIMIAMFIVQVSQLMLAVMTVNYAAFAAARAASVWVPAHVAGGLDTIDEPANVLPFPIREDLPVLLTFDADRVENAQGVTLWEYRAGSGTPRSAKYASVYTAAAMACLPLAPSRDLGGANALQNQAVHQTALAAYRALVPASAGNVRLADRLSNKIIYAFENTSVRLEFVDKDTREGPTYNPRLPVELEDGTIVRVWNPQEVGWQDPLTVTVTHEFALLPGPGRWLARHLVRADGRPDRVSPRIGRFTAPNRERVDTTAVWATATMTAEGLKPLLTYVQNTE